MWLIRVPKVSTDALGQLARRQQEIALVSTNEQAVDLYRRASKKLWTLHPYRTGDYVEFKSINVTVAIAMFYQKVKLS